MAGREVLPPIHTPSVVLAKPVNANAVLPVAVASSAEAAAKTGLSVTETFHMAEKSLVPVVLHLRPT